MKKLFLLITLFTFYTHHSISQWLQMPSFPVSGSAYSVAFINKDTGYVSMDTPALLRTTNGGQSWAMVGSYRIFELQFVDNLYGYGRGNLSGNGRIYKTTNGGFSWDSVSVSPVSYTGIFFVNRDTGWIGGYDGTFSRVWLTTNGGVSLQPQLTQAGSAFNRLFFLKQKINGEYYGWLLQDPALSRTTNSGLNWNFIYQMESVPICGLSGSFGDFYFKDTLNGVATRSGGCYMISTNAGYNWSFTKYNGSGQPNKIGLATSQIGWITLSNDTLIKTTNFFQTYGKQKHFAISGSGSIFVIDTANAFTASYLFGKTTNGGGNYVSVTQISSEVPEQYSLSQNYPNPFNPKTNIKYQISKGNFVLLKVYDVLGKEILILVNEKQTAGTYEVKWDASKYPSGIYIYKLITGSYTETKKAVLIK